MKVHFRLRYKIFISSVILGELEALRINKGILVYFTNIVGIILSFPKLIAGLFLVLTMTFLSIFKKQALPFQITEVPCENSLKEILSDQRPSEQII